ncbi:unnamed protein product [Schistosoma turkestanicum]|nr:unnamed protein product [Schistosoma turkestanicum]
MLNNTLDYHQHHQHSQQSLHKKTLLPSMTSSSPSSSSTATTTNTRTISSNVLFKNSIKSNYSYSSQKLLNKFKLNRIKDSNAILILNRATNIKRKSASIHLHHRSIKQKRLTACSLTNPSYSPTTTTTTTDVTSLSNSSQYSSVSLISNNNNSSSIIEQNIDQCSILNEQEGLLRKSIQNHISMTHLKSTHNSPTSKMITHNDENNNNINNNNKLTYSMSHLIDHQNSYSKLTGKASAFSIESIIAKKQKHVTNLNGIIMNNNNNHDDDANYDQEFATSHISSSSCSTNKYANDKNQYFTSSLSYLSSSVFNDGK